MIGTKEQVREFICESNKPEWDAYMAGKSNITMMDMINFTRASSTLKFYEAVIWLFRAHEINGYDNSFYVDDLYNYIKSENDKNEEWLVPSFRLDDIKQECINHCGFYDTHDSLVLNSLNRIGSCIEAQDPAAKMKLADFMEAKVNGNN